MNIIFLNQVAGPLFCELAEYISGRTKDSCLVSTGHVDAINRSVKNDNIKYRLAPSYNRKSYLKRFMSWFYYIIDSGIYVIKNRKNTFLFISTNPPLLGPMIWLLNKLFNIPYAIIVYDIHPDTLISMGVIKEESYIAKIWRYLNKITLESAEVVFTIGVHMSGILNKHFDVSKTTYKKIAVVAPWANTDIIQPIPKNKNPFAHHFQQENILTVLYSGNFGITHDIETILEVSRLLKNRSDIKFLLIGGGEKWQLAKDYSEKYNLKNLSVYPYESEENLPFTLSLGDISLVTVEEGAENLMVPSKLFNYMATGSAIIGICKGENDLRLIIEASKCGVCVPPKDPGSLKHEIERFVENRNSLQECRQNSRRAALKNYSHKVCPKEIYEVLASLGLFEK